jgi:hypothetical protein
MKIHLSFLIVPFLLLSSTAQAAGPARSLLPARSTDQVPAQLQAPTLDKASTATLDRRPVAMSWAIDAQVPLDARPTPFEQRSREYWIDASGAQLQRGLPLSTSATGALIRLSPHAGNRGTLDIATLGIRANGKLFASTEALRTAADEDALRAAGMDVPHGSVVVKLADAVGFGAIELIAPAASGDWLVHVFEPASRIVMTLRADRDTALAGQPIRFRAAVEGGAALDGLDGLLNSPDGHVQDVHFTRQADGSFLATVQADGAHAGGFGLWEIHAFGNASARGISVPRDARNAFAVSVASARFNGSIETIAAPAKEAGLVLRVGVESASASRYQLAGVLYGTRTDGSLGPAVMAHSAAWLEAGNGSIDLRIDAGALRASGASAPYELRDLRLINQADMSLIERRERAAVVF